MVWKGLWMVKKRVDVADFMSANWLSFWYTGFSSVVSYPVVGIFQRQDGHMNFEPMGSGPWQAGHCGGNMSLVISAR